MEPPQNPVCHIWKSGFSSKHKVIYIYIILYIYIHIHSENFSTDILNLEADQVFSKDPLGPPKLWPTMQVVGPIGRSDSRLFSNLQNCS